MYAISNRAPRQGFEAVLPICSGWSRQQRDVIYGSRLKLQISQQRNFRGENPIGRRTQFGQISEGLSSGKYRVPSSTTGWYCRGLTSPRSAWNPRHGCRIDMQSMEFRRQTPLRKRN
ncbi:unnamed protein product [Cuscuta epithymum]|uniref:Uncharacterized protein n=1 Tax=Cuscuta epithymum TaxID=186058 RepID=A0AAV0E2R7_9ASTE|nr:unnamed protein product [Cuscuta epithymum]